MELRNATRQEFFDLGEDLRCCGNAVDDLEELSKQNPINELLGTTELGFDRGNMIQCGKRVIALLRRSRSVMASMNMATQDLSEPFLEIEDLFSESEAEVYEYLVGLTYSASNDIDRVRGLFRDYSDEIGILEQQENNKTKATAV